MVDLYHCLAMMFSGLIMPRFRVVQLALLHKRHDEPSANDAMISLGDKYAR